MALYSAPNPIVTPLLRSPLHWLCSGTLALLTVTGKKTGARHPFPVMYARDGETIVIVAAWASKKRWWKNVVGGADVELVLRRKTVRGRATAFVDDPVERGKVLRAMAARFPGAATSLGLPKNHATLDDAALGATPADCVAVRVVLEP
jgi:deazaflavin-dependent oxidoreductase (nitroreductase family)